MQPQPDAVVAQRVDFGDRSDAGWTPSETVVNQSLDPHLGWPSSATLQHDTELSGAFSGVLEFTVNKRDVDLAIGMYEHDAKGEYTRTGVLAATRQLRRGPPPAPPAASGAPQRLAVKDTRLLGRKLAAGSRIVVTLGVIKQPDMQLNLGSGNPWPRKSSPMPANRWRSAGAATVTSTCPCGNEARACGARR
jgi:hypothetical protein